MKRGSVMLETVIVMPLLLILVMGVLQITHIWMAKQMTIYAAYCATRAIMVVPPGKEQKNAARKTAEIALSWINIADEWYGSGCHPSCVSIPGWGKIRGSGYSQAGFADEYDGGKIKRMTTEVIYDGTEEEVASVKVTFRFPLVFPGMGVSRIFAHFTNNKGAAPIKAEENKSAIDFIAENTGDIVEIDGWPYMEFEEKCVLPMPYSTENFPENAFKGVKIRGGS